MKGNLKGFVDFGIKPTTTYAAAGYDFYIPNLVTEEQQLKAFEAFKQSYNKTDGDLIAIHNKIALYMEAISGVDNDALGANFMNMVMLFLSLDAQSINMHKTLDGKIDEFITHYLVFDEKKNVPGIKVQLNDHVKINSGVKVALDPETAGIFYNKSGMGTRGWDTRACVVDEDYSGYVHLSGSYTKDNKDGGIIYCGDKFSQMVIEVIVRGDEFEELTEDKYNEAMKDSKRGSNAMGSSDVKH